MLCAHMDELGFIVQHVEDEGFVRIAPVGYHDDRMVIDQDLRIHGRKGPVDGVTGAKPAHVLPPEEAKKAIPLEDMFVDVGTSSREATEELGVRVGDLVTFARPAGLLNGTRVFTGKAVDDRSGCAVMVEVMRRLPADTAATVVRDRGRAGGARHPRRGARGDPHRPGRGPRHRRHPVRRHPRDRVLAPADQARRGAGDQVLRLGARDGVRHRRAAADDRPARARRRGGRRSPTSARC